ncbi:hypothetical protein [Brumimicrobium mesophilum]|uniref:hypothetical protein n=1 Tax=Brumimicrobium mesophilum TaxID=392717 RepID=UPI000D143E4E|nr:hypothetical protein [Brumimicrobium mesophilum]
MVPSINLGTDSLGFGQIVQGLGNATGTAECGSKPTCLSFTKTCKEKNSVYNDCRMKALEVKQTMANNIGRSVSDSAAEEKVLPERVIYAVVGIVILIVLVKIFKK